MSAISVSVTNAGGASVSVSNGSTVNATVGNGGAVNVAIGTISPGNATIVSGTLTINSTTTLAAGSQAYVKNDSGTPYAAKLDFGIPSGPVTLVGVGETTTLAPGSNATVTGTASGSNLTLAFGIPRGATPSFAIGNVTTGAAGSSASVVATATNSGANVTLDLTIPRGDPGTSGSNGTNGTSITLSSGTPANLGTASAGSSNLAARADHIHNLPVIAYGNLSGTPTNFPTNTTLVSGLNSSYSAINHVHNYVTSLNNLTGGLTLAAGGNVTLTANGSTLTIDSQAGLDGNSVIDGGDYFGQILGGITFTLLPQSQSLTASTSLSFGNVFQPSVPAVADGGSLTVYGIGVGYGNQIIQISQATQSPYRTASFLASNDNGSSFSSLLTIAYSAQIGFNPTLIPPQFASNGSRVVFTSGFTGVFEPQNVDASRLRYFAEGDSIANAAVSNGSGTSVAYLSSSGRFVSISSGDILSSSDGVTWTSRSTLTDAKFVFAVGSRFVVISASQAIKYSSDGVTWTTGPSKSFSSAAFNGSRIVAAGNGVAAVEYTTDGLSWTSVALPVAVRGVSYAAGLFWALASASSSTDALTSPDGVTWTLGALPSSTQLVSASSASGSNVALLLAGQNAFKATSTSATASASLTVSATSNGGAAISYQWQRSVDAGTTWVNVTNATSTTLSLAGLTASDNGTRYRVAASATGATTVFSQSATLTVTG
jgi:hypothetical protein